LNAPTLENNNVETRMSSLQSMFKYILCLVERRREKKADRDMYPGSSSKIRGSARTWM